MEACGCWGRGGGRWQWPPHVQASHRLTGWPQPPACPLNPYLLQATYKLRCGCACAGATRGCAGERRGARRIGAWQSFQGPDGPLPACSAQNLLHERPSHQVQPAPTRPGGSGAAAVCTEAARERAALHLTPAPGAALSPKRNATETGVNYLFADNMQPDQVRPSPAHKPGSCLCQPLAHTQSMFQGAANPPTPTHARCPPPLRPPSCDLTGGDLVPR